MRRRNAAEPSVYDTLSRLARRTTTGFASLLSPSAASTRLSDPGGGGELIYKLRHWPDLPTGLKTAAIFRTLSVMSSRPVNRHWILSTSGLPAEQVDLLLANLQFQGAVDVIDSSRFAKPD